MAGVLEPEQRKIRLQAEPQFCRRGIKDIIWRNLRFGWTVECDYLCPFETHHVERQLLSRRCPVRLFPEKLFEPVAKIAQGVRIGRVTCQVCCDQLYELPFPDDCSQTWIVVIEAIENAEPVLAVVDL